MLLTPEPARLPPWMRVLLEKQGCSYKASLPLRLLCGLGETAFTGRHANCNSHLTHKQGLLGVGRIRSLFTEDLSLQSLPIYLTTHNTDFCRQLRRSVPLSVSMSASTVA